MKSIIAACCMAVIGIVAAQAQEPPLTAHPRASLFLERFRVAHSRIFRMGDRHAGQKPTRAGCLVICDNAHLGCISTRTEPDAIAVCNRERADCRRICNGPGFASYEATPRAEPLEPVKHSQGALEQPFERERIGAEMVATFRRE
jgi:hypothetical protein